MDKGYFTSVIRSVVLKRSLSTRTMYSLLARSAPSIESSTFRSAAGFPS